MLQRKEKKGIWRLNKSRKRRSRRWCDKQTKFLKTHAACLQKKGKAKNSEELLKEEEEKKEEEKEEEEKRRRRKRRRCENTFLETHTSCLQKK